MCLAEIWTDEQMAEWLEGQGEVIEVEKVVFNTFCGEKAFYPPVTGRRYENGLNITGQHKINAVGFSYFSGYHFYWRKTGSIRWVHPWGKITVRCLIKKEWITAIGMGRSDGNEYEIVIVASQAIFPHFPEVEARYEDLPKEEIAQPEMAVNSSL